MHLNKLNWLSPTFSLYYALDPRQNFRIRVQNFYPNWTKGIVLINFHALLKQSKLLCLYIKHDATSQ